ncbi:hypothetical protein [Bradyrhizobium sp. RDM4]|uniref:hypothetical protein n=1 Tax=Bradyrhizobium sp. RDM4 TaxID=3378765 RepID=UPI0038FC0EAE
MPSPFDSVHLDPSLDPPEPYRAVFELFSELWAKLRGLEPSCAQDPVLLVLIRHLEHQLVAAGLVLTMQLDVLNHR